MHSHFTGYYKLMQHLYCCSTPEGCASLSAVYTPLIFTLSGKLPYLLAITKEFLSRGEGAAFLELVLFNRLSQQTPGRRYQN